MTEELGQLLDTIQREGIDKAEAEGDKIREEARREADRIREEARREAEQIKDRAHEEADRYQADANRALEQAARNVIVAAGRGIERLLGQCAEDCAGQALDSETVRALLLRMTEQYVEHDVKGMPMHLTLSEEDRKQLGDFISHELREKWKHGVNIHVDPTLKKGFKVQFEGRNHYHDFSREAIAEQMMRYLEPRLRDLVGQAAQTPEED